MFIDNRPLKDFFFRLVRPDFWVQIKPTDHDYSDHLEVQLDNNPRVTYSGSHTTTVNGVTLWTSNYPYAYGSLYSTGLKKLPSGRVRKKLKKLVDEVTNKNPWEK